MAGIFSRRVTPKSGLVGIVAGFVLGMLRLVLQAMHRAQGIEWPWLIQAFVDINWLYFSFLLFVFTCALICVVSKFTPKASAEQLAGLTYSSVIGAAERGGPPDLWFLGDFPHLRDPRNHRQHLHLLLVDAGRLRYDATPADHPVRGSRNGFSGGTWRSLVAHLHGVQGVPSSNLGVPTNLFLLT